MDTIKLEELQVKFLAAAKAYYVLRSDKEILSDLEFDLLCRTLIREYDDTDWFSTHVSLEDLQAGTGYAIKWEALPDWVNLEIDEML